MSNTLLRLGLWTVILVLALYVLDESFADEPFAEIIDASLLQKALVVGGAVIIAGMILRILEKGKKAVIKNRCRVCRTALPPGAMYCREHLRSILSDEDEKTHATRVRR